MTSARLTLVVLCLFACASAAAQDPRTGDREQLRALLKRGADALNTRNLDSMSPYVTPEFTLITLDDKKLRGIAAVKDYYKSLYEGPGAVLKAIETHPEADDLTTFIDEKAGVSWGTSKDRYTFTNGDAREMTSRWSAVVQKDGGTWKLVSVHFSANLLDNPVVDTVKASMRNLAIIVGAVMLVIGLAAGMLIRRRRVQAA